MSAYYRIITDVMLSPDARREAQQDNPHKTQIFLNEADAEKARLALPNNKRFKVTICYAVGMKVL